jgi:hypothetical protein
MKSPLRYQASKWDCGPTTFLNAITYLFDNDSIPPIAIKYIYLFTLDQFECRGTNWEPLERLGKLFNQFKPPIFSLTTKVLKGREVHCGKDSEIYKHLNNSGVAICYFNSAKQDHYMLATDIDHDYIFLFDPWYRTRIQDLNKNVIHSPSDGSKPNLQIKRKWIDKESEKFSFGPKEGRWCLLIEKG